MDCGFFCIVIVHTLFPSLLSLSTVNTYHITKGLMDCSFENRLGECSYKQTISLQSVQVFITSLSGYLTLKVLVTTIDAQWEGMGDVGSARYELTLLSPCPTIRVLSYCN